MKKSFFLILALALCLSFSACSENTTEIQNTEIQEENTELKNAEPEVSQIKSICELATMECYYHNVAKYFEEDSSGALWWKKDRNFWIEYAGIVTVGIDVSKVNMKIEDDNITITLPKAQVLGCKIDENTLTKDSFVVAKDSAKVEAEHQTEAFKEAQEKMKQSANEDTLLLENAQQRAKKLLEDYINNIGECFGQKYSIDWVYLDDEPLNEAELSSEDSH